jgi:hypothetical protein
VAAPLSLCLHLPRSLVRTGREIMVAWLQDEMRQASVADLQRAAEFLEFARMVRKGCAKQRSGARRAQSNAWRKFVDPAMRW